MHMLDIEQTAVSSGLYLVTGKSRQSSQTLFCLSKPGHLLIAQEKYVGFVTCHCTGNSETVHLFYCLPKAGSLLCHEIINNLIHLKFYASSKAENKTMITKKKKKPPFRDIPNLLPYSNTDKGP